jgi:hypothetical protein
VAAAAPSKKPRVSVAPEHEEGHIDRDTLVLRLSEEREWQQFKVGHPPRCHSATPRAMSCVTAALRRRCACADNQQDKRQCAVRTLLGGLPDGTRAIGCAHSQVLGLYRGRKGWFHAVQCEDGEKLALQLDWAQVR